MARGSHWMATCVLFAVLYLGAMIVPETLENLYVDPNQITLEQPYPVRSIAGTRRAYNLDEQAVDEREFTVSNEVSSNLRRHIRYPEDIFTVQAEMYGTYHMTNPTTFYNREDRWEAPHELFRDREIEMVPYYVTAQLPGSGNPEFLLMLPMSVAGKNQMAGWERRRLVTADVAGEDAGLAVLVSGLVERNAIDAGQPPDSLAGIAQHAGAKQLTGRHHLHGRNGEAERAAPVMMSAELRAALAACRTRG